MFVSLDNCERIVKNQITGFGMPVFMASEQKKILPKGNSEKYPSFSHSGSLSDRLNNAREDEKYTGYEIGMNFELFAQ